MIKAGVLSDTHLTRVNQEFLDAVRQCFADCKVIIHAGDIVAASVLDLFSDRTVYAVHGNCCGQSTQAGLPERLDFRLGTFRIGLIHGNQLGRDLESSLIALFPESNCMIYGHTHQPVCRWVAGKLIVNPGSFQTSGRYGAPCTYAILEAGEQLKGKIHEFSLR